MAGHPDDGVNLLVGAETLHVPSITFWVLERGFMEHVNALAAATTRGEQTWASIDLVLHVLDTLGVDHMWSREDIAKKMRADQIGPFCDGVLRLLEVSGLVPKGEAAVGSAPVAMDPTETLPATAPPSSPSS